VVEEGILSEARDRLFPEVEIGDEHLSRSSHQATAGASPESRREVQDALQRLERVAGERVEAEREGAADLRQGHAGPPVEAELRLLVELLRDSITARIAQDGGEHVQRCCVGVAGIGSPPAELQGTIVEAATGASDAWTDHRHRVRDLGSWTAASPALERALDLVEHGDGLGV